MSNYHSARYRRSHAFVFGAARLIDLGNNDRIIIAVRN